MPWGGLKGLGVLGQHMLMVEDGVLQRNTYKIHIGGSIRGHKGHSTPLNYQEGKYNAHQEGKYNAHQEGKYNAHQEGKYNAHQEGKYNAHQEGKYNAHQEGKYNAHQEGKYNAHQEGKYNAHQEGKYNAHQEGKYNAHPSARQGVHCGLSIASEVFLIFTTRLYSCNFNAIVFIYRQERSIAAGILPTPSTSPSSLPVGSKGLFI